MMKQVEQTTLFDMPEAKPFRRKRIFTSEAIAKRAASRKAHLSERNRFIALRYYYWTEIIRRRTDDVMSILSMQEFFVDEQTIWNIILSQGDYLKEMNEVRPTLRYLRTLYPSFKW